MTYVQVPRFSERATSFSRGGAIAVSLIGMLVLLGWMLDIGVLKGLPGQVSVKANTALALTLAGLALLVLAARPASERTPGADRLRRLARGCAVLVVLIGVLTLGEYLAGWDLRIDQLLFQDSAGAVATSHPGRMSPLTALSLVLLGAALLRLDDAPRPGFCPAEWLSLAAVCVAFFALLGYLFDVEGFYRPFFQTAMAGYTGVACLLLSVAVLSARPDRHLMTGLSRRDAGGTFIRRALPAAIVVPLVLTWLHFVGEQIGLYSVDAGITFYGFASVIVVCALIWVAAQALGRMDLARGESERLSRLVDSSPTVFYGARISGDYGAT